MHRDRFRPRSPPAWFWALAYAAALLIIAPSPDIRYADEGHYLEASLQMSLGGDWLVPLDSAGRLALEGPAPVYWPAAAAFKALGYSMLSARLPFILGGALTVWLIAWFGARLADREAGRLAAMCLAASLPWMWTGLRTLPDVWLTLFMTLSAGGFLLLLNGTHRREAPWLAWLGLGLAVATRGPVALLPLPALALVGWFWRGDVVWRDLLHRPAVMAGMGVGLLYYAAVAIRLGPSAVPPIVIDPYQAAAWGEVVDRAFVYLAYLPLALMPFTLLALGVRPVDWRWLGRDPARKTAAGYALVLSAILVMAFSFASRSTGGRDLMPALPWLALLLGMLLRSAIAAGRPRRWLGASTTALVGLVGLVMLFGIAAVGVATGLVTGHESLVWRVAALTLVAVAVLLAAQGGTRRALILPALMTLALPPALFGVARPALPGGAQAIVAEVARADSSNPVVMAGADSLAGTVRVLSGGRIEVRRDVNPMPGPDEFGALVIARSHLANNDAYADCEQRQVAKDFRAVRPKGLVAAVRAGEGEAYLNDRSLVYLMVTCPAPSGEASAPETGS
jgi:4-amino-4-deoxy-L-arabinose transferase-like glycosyltransferase